MALGIINGEEPRAFEFTVWGIEGIEIDPGFGRYEQEGGIYIIDDLPNGVKLTVLAAYRLRTLDTVRITVSVP